MSPYRSQRQIDRYPRRRWREWFALYSVRIAVGSLMAVVWFCLGHHAQAISAAILAVGVWQLCKGIRRALLLRRCRRRYDEVALIRGGDTESMRRRLEALREIERAIRECES